MPITETELTLLKSAKTDAAWNAACDEIKAARGGQYPPDWYDKVIAAGLLGHCRITISPLPNL
jgi:hypothetical protein